MLRPDRAELRAGTKADLVLTGDCATCYPLTVTDGFSPYLLCDLAWL
jgi:hypothetical protein